MKVRKRMIGKKVKWLLTWYGSTGEPSWGKGDVVAEQGDWLVVKSYSVKGPHGNPFVVKRYSEIELA